jgi:hypothetical protein
MVRAWRAGFAALLGLALASGFASDAAFADSSLNPLSWFGNSQPTKESEKLIKLPASAADVDCPPVDVFEGGATSRVGGPANDAVRYQFDISDVSRECDPQGTQFALKVGIAGRLLIGPAGSPGAYATTLRLQVKRDLDDKVLFDKSYHVAADTAGAVQAPYRIVTDPILLPLTRARLDMDYSISVGLGSGGAAAVTRHRRARHKG